MKLQLFYFYFLFFVVCLESRVDCLPYPGILFLEVEQKINLDLNNFLWSGPMVLYSQLNSSRLKLLPNISQLWKGKRRMEKGLHFGGGRLLPAGVGVMVSMVEGAC